MLMIDGKILRALSSKPIRWGQAALYVACVAASLLRYTHTGMDTVLKLKQIYLVTFFHHQLNLGLVKAIVRK